MAEQPNTAASSRHAYCSTFNPPYCVDNHLCNMFVEFCHHAHLGVRCLATTAPMKTKWIIFLTKTIEL
ncbi:hypothetical protein EMCRGX_G023304 [Ephydatia muelleri]